MDLYQNGNGNGNGTGTENVNGVPIDPTYSADGGGNSWMDPWLDMDKWSWWFKYAAIYVVVVYVCLIAYQIISPKANNIEKLKNMIDRDEKWAEVQSAYNIKPSVGPPVEQKVEQKVGPPAESPDLAKRAMPFALLADMNERRIQLLTSIWEWSRDGVSDFMARRSVRLR